jgi:amino acid adenylation domain-containing protein
MNEPTFDRAQIEGSIVQRFESIARERSNQIAVTDRGQRWTYGELNQFANRIAHNILAERASGEGAIPFLLGHGGGVVSAALGVLKARSIYCALDPSHPPTRLRQIMRELQPSLIITDSANAQLAVDIGENRLPLIFIDKIGNEHSSENPELSATPPLAAIFYTSGSTGEPKGVQQRQRTMLHRVWCDASSMQISTRDRISLLFSLSFSASFGDVFTALLNGARLCLYDLKAEGLDGLAEWLLGERITWFHIPLGALRQFLDSQEAEKKFQDVRVLVPSGALFRSDLERLWSVFPNSKLISHMGSSETSIVARILVTPETQFTGDVVPIGYPVPDKQVLILDEAGQPLPREKVGEIAVRSRYIASGYWKRPDLTARVFLPDPDGGDENIYRMGDFGRISAEGYLEYLGRRDAQIKIRGYRVDISEVEAALHRQHTIKEAAVVARADANGEKKLVAYVVPRQEFSNIPEDLRAALLAELPDYMVPAAFVTLTELPRTSNGKVDTARLPAPSRDRPPLAVAYTAPRNDLEKEVAELWAALLDVDRVGIHDKFLNLGGHSLLATQLGSRILHRYGVRLSPSLLFETGTVATQAAAIAGNLPAGADEVLELLEKVEQLSDDEIDTLIGPERQYLENERPSDKA